MNNKIFEAIAQEALLPMAIVCLLAGAARGEAVGACRESQEGYIERSCERATPEFKSIVVTPKLIDARVTPEVTELKKPIVGAPPKVVIAPITLTKPLTLSKAPELEAGGMVGALTLLGAAILVMRGRKRRLDG
jgi:hypothetical protein